jgi:hypothetical protein
MTSITSDSVWVFFYGEVFACGQVKDHSTPVTHVLLCRWRWPLSTGETTNAVAIFHPVEWDRGTFAIASRVEVFALPPISGASKEKIGHESLLAHDWLQESDLFRVQRAFRFMQDLFRWLRRLRLRLGNDWRWLRWRLRFGDDWLKKFIDHFFLLLDFVRELLDFRLVSLNGVFEVFGGFILELIHLSLVLDSHRLLLSQKILYLLLLS